MHPAAYNFKNLTGQIGRGSCGTGSIITSHHLAKSCSSTPSLATYDDVQDFAQAAEVAGAALDNADD
jgi:hypothetical protein